MKVRILLIIVLITSVSFVNAQSIGLGLKGGANINKLSGIPFNEEFSYSYHAGAYVQIGLGKKFTLQPEVLFSQVTADTATKFSDIYSPPISQIKLKYLTIPVLLNYKLSKILELQAGPQFGILLDQNVGLLANGENAFKEGELSLLGGLQANIGSFKIYGRYGFGLNNISDVDNKDEWKNQFFQVGIALKLL